MSLSRPPALSSLCRALKYPAGAVIGALMGASVLVPASLGASGVCRMEGSELVCVTVEDAVPASVPAPTADFPATNGTSETPPIDGRAEEDPSAPHPPVGGPESVAPVRGSKLEILTAMTSAVGSATQEDIDVILPELAKLPRKIIETLSREGWQIAVCRDSVVDAIPSLRGRTPGRYHVVAPGVGYEGSLGLSLNRQKITLVCTYGDETWRGASTTDARHEACHGYAHVTQDHLSQEFGEIYDQVNWKLLPYFRVEPRSSALDETYAEFCAKTFDGVDHLVAVPELEAYFRRMFPTEPTE